MPGITGLETLAKIKEASPNLPRVHARIVRPREVSVRFLDETGALRERAL